MDTKELVFRQLELHPLCQPQDLVKALYQSILGCGHLLRDLSAACTWLEKEMREAEPVPGMALSEELGDYARLNLAPCRDAGLSPDTAYKLFSLSAQAESCEARTRFENALTELKAMSAGGELPFSDGAFLRFFEPYAAAGCPSLHHSETYRAAYFPAYRIVRTEYARLLPIFCRIDRLLSAKDRVLLAVDGCCGSGKSTLAGLLSRVYDAEVFHMDDFFLRPEQRTPERFAVPGENVDHERFLEEVLLPLRNGKKPVYRPFDCHTLTVSEPAAKRPTHLSIIEGSYSFHPSLAPLYDDSVFLEIPGEIQKERILRRSGEAMLPIFVNRWIPMENRYFEAFSVPGHCGLLLRVSEDENHNNRYEVIRK